MDDIYMAKPKLIRITTVPQSLRGLLKGQLRFMSQNGYDVIGISSQGDALNDVANNEGVRVVPIEMTRTISPLKDLRALYLLTRFFWKEKPKIVHTHTPKAGLLGMIAARICGVEHRLHTVAGMPLTVARGAKRRLLNFVERVTYTCATKIYPNSSGLNDIILENKFTSFDKIKVIGKGSSNGIDTTEFDPDRIPEEDKRALRDQLGIQQNDFVFLFVGRLVKDKGITELVEAFENVYTKFRNTHLVLVGSFERSLDPLPSKVEKAIIQHPNIHSVGYQSNVINYFAFSDALAFPSYREGFPNVVMQAAAMQLNCIVSDINGCNEIIRNGSNGWIVPVGDVDNLYDRMEWCLLNKEECCQMGLRSRRIMKSDYERQFVWQEILNEYKALDCV